MADGRNTFFNQSVMKDSSSSNITNHAMLVQQALLAGKKIEMTYADIFIFAPLLECYKQICEYIDKNGECCSAVNLTKKAGAFLSWIGGTSSTSTSSHASSGIEKQSSELQKDRVSTFFSYVGMKTNQELAVSIKNKIEQTLNLSKKSIEVFYQPAPSIYPPTGLAIYSTVLELNSIFKDMPDEIVLPIMSHLKPGSQVKKALQAMLSSYEERAKAHGLKDSIFSEKCTSHIFKSA